MFLGIEIGGTKLQLAIGPGDGSRFATHERHDVNVRRGASGILQQIENSSRSLIQNHPVRRIGIGFGGPVDSASGRIIKSHQIDGWEGLPLASWATQTLGIPTVVGNDCDVAALAEAQFGSGRGKHTIFFVTVGTGVGGGLVIGGKLHGYGRPAVAEIGHLRPGLHADRPDATVEALSSGWGIVATAQARNLDLPTAKNITKAAMEGNQVAGEVLQGAFDALGWAIAQVITLIAPDVVVVGGGLSLMGHQRFFMPLRAAVARYVFPPLENAYQIEPATLGEEVVVHGALALAAASGATKKDD